MDSKYKFREGKYVEGPNGRINYVLSFPNKSDKEKYNGPLVLCFHGLLGSLSSYDEFEKECLKSELAVLRMDMPGHGLSHWRYFGSLTLDDFTKQVDTVLNCLGLSEMKLYLVGISMGGLFSIHYAGLYPNKVLKVAALCPAGYCKEPNILQKFVLNYFPLGLYLVENAFPTYMFSKRKEFEDDFYDYKKVNEDVIESKFFRHRYYGRQLRATFSRVVTGFDFWNNDQVYERFSKNYISLRGDSGVCFYLGLHDELVTIDSIISKLTKLIPKSRAIVYEKCKHQVLDEPDTIISDIINYLKLCSSQEYYQSIGVSVDSIKIEDD
ncbi:alpha/beta hydrolase superfamily protein [Cryptosporidium ryanae]|uniref:alpha/beta hydrolase superfamily protein n=1 Tax=Cryptosporidium ryanae TaxID=515981 RepID=UPI00351A42C8|nr:alpha/beta hydrolase superfamily protein [Cryptosporidium ryanae]